MEKKIKRLFIAFIILTSVIGLFVLLYLKGIPALVKSIFFKNIIQESVYNFSGCHLTVEGLEFLPSVKPNVIIKLDNLILSKDGTNILILKDSKLKLSFRKILKKQLKIKGIYANEIYININELPQSKTKNKKSKFKTNFISSDLNIKNFTAKYNTNTDTNILVHGKNLLIKNYRFNKKELKYDINTTITNNNEKIFIKFNDNGSSYIFHKQLKLNNIPININNSIILANYIYEDKKSYPIAITSKSFNAKTAHELLNLLIPKNELSKNFANLNGNFGFEFTIDGKNSKGSICLKKINFNLIPAENMKFTIHNGNIDFTKDEFKITNLQGFYENKNKNKFDINGTIKPKFANLIGNAVITDDFAKHYISKKAGYPVGMKGNADTRIVFKLNDKLADVLWLYKFENGNGFIIDGEDFGSTDSKRVLVSKMKIDPYFLNITNLDYFVGSPDEDKLHKKPILSFYGKIDLKNNFKLINFGFKIPDYLTSRFFNLLVRDELFRKGKIKGELEYINTGKFPKLNGAVSVENAGIPSQKTFIKAAVIQAHGDSINISSIGKYRTSDYKINANIINRMFLPIIIKDIHLTIDNLDVEKFLSAVNGNNQHNESSNESSANKESEDIDLSGVIVEKGHLNLIKGKFKNINFDNVIADLTFDKHQILNINSNKFNFAEGKTSADIICNLKEKLYSAKLNVEEVNSDLIANSLLGLYDEVSGKANGLIELNTDKTLKLNGKMQFQITNGIISKIGLFEYILKFTTILRNPIVTVSPSMVIDIVNLPKGRFDLNEGTLQIKNNIINHISITSSSPQISSYIGGKYDIDNHDSALRIYIKFGSKARGIYGLIRNISLSSLANKTPFGAKTSNNFYEREIEKIPPLEEHAEKDSKIYLVKIDGDIENNNFISFLKKLK